MSLQQCDKRGPWSPELNVAVVCGHLVPDHVAVLFAFVVQVLVAAPTADGGHPHHPEVVGVGPQGVQGLLEADFDLEAAAVELDDFQGCEGEQGSHEDDPPSRRVIDEYEANEAPYGSPEKISGEVANLKVGFAVDRARGC